MYEVELTVQGMQLVEAWRGGNREALSAALATDGEDQTRLSFIDWVLRGREEAMHERTARWL